MSAPKGNTNGKGKLGYKKPDGLVVISPKLHPAIIEAIKDYQARHQLKSQGDVIEQGVKLLLLLEQLAEP
jgi:hypothetical protein